MDYGLDLDYDFNPSGPTAHNNCFRRHCSQRLFRVIGYFDSEFDMAKMNICLVS